MSRSRLSYRVENCNLSYLFDFIKHTKIADFFSSLVCSHSTSEINIKSRKKAASKEERKLVELLKNDFVGRTTTDFGAGGDSCV